MVHVFVYGMPVMGEQKLKLVDKEIRDAVADHAATGGPHNVLAFFMPAQQVGTVIIAHILGLVRGTHVVPSKQEGDGLDDLCEAVGKVIERHRPKGWKGIEVFSLPDSVLEGSASSPT